MSSLEFFQHPLGWYAMFALLVAVPVARVFMRAGCRPWWTLLLGVPLAGFVLCLAVLALRPWPAQGRGQ